MRFAVCYFQLSLFLQERFTHDMQPHYIYSPREMTRWVRGIYEAVKPLETLPIDGLVRIWAHEALRLFQDRLVYDEERTWTDENVNLFPTVDSKVSGSGLVEGLLFIYYKPFIITSW